MKATTRKIFILWIVALALVIALSTGLATAQVSGQTLNSISTPDRLETSLGTLEFRDGVPSKETAAKVYDNLDLMHGIEAFVNASRAHRLPPFLMGSTTPAFRTMRFSSSRS